MVDWPHWLDRLQPLPPSVRAALEAAAVSGMQGSGFEAAAGARRHRSLLQAGAQDNVQVQLQRYATLQQPAACDHLISSSFRLATAC